MQKLLKSKIFHVLGVVAVVLSVIMLNFGSLTKTAIEKIASNTMQTKVTIDSLDISVADQSVMAKGIIVANPKGFTTPYLLKINKVSVTAEDLMGDVIILKEILVDGLDIQYEITTNGSNISVIEKSLKSSGSNSSSKNDTGKSLIINTLRIANSKVTPTISLGNKGVKPVVLLPDITVANIGSESKPASPTKAITKSINALLSAASTAVTKAGFGNDLINGVGDTFNDRRKQADKALKGLFGK